MEDYGFSVSRWQNTDSILSTINCLQTLNLFRFNIDIPVAAIDDCGLQAAIKHGRSRTRKVCLVLMLTKICGDKLSETGTLPGFFFLLGDTWPAFSRVSLSLAPWGRVGENPGNELVSVPGDFVYAMFSEINFIIWPSCYFHRQV